MSEGDKLFTIDFWNVGQGDATSISLPSGDLILIDVGPKNSSLSQWLRSAFRRRIHRIILSHNDADHAGALPEIVEELHARIDQILMLEDRNRNEPQMHGLFRPVYKFWNTGYFKVNRLECVDKPHELWRDDSLNLRLLLRHPQFVDNIQSRSPNDASAILTLDQAEKTLVTWPGDASLSRIVGVTPHSPELLFGPHHGAPQDRKNQQFSNNLHAVAPRNCFISVGTKNHKDKHPNPLYVGQLTGNGCHVICSQMTTNCDAERIRNKQHVMNTNGYYGLPAPAQGVFCRGHVRMTVSSDGLEHDHYHKEHIRRLLGQKKIGRRLLCATGLN